MYLGKDQKNPWVYVDDSDPSITYSANWLVNTGLHTDLSSLTDPESVNTLFYGTLHSTSTSLVLVDTYSFWYLFNGKHELGLCVYNTREKKGILILSQGPTLQHFFVEPNRHSSQTVQ